MCFIPAKANIERRKWARLPLAIPVFVRSRDDKGKEFLEFATALNISAAGALVAVRRLLPVAAQLSLEIPSAPLAATAKLPKALRTLRAKCVRVTHAEGYHLVGLKFSRPLLSDSKLTRSRQRKDGSTHVKRFSSPELASPA
ncbi:MAG: PilZ domain-containing protein [Acidobacteria bacterium]|nr:PilZ domain-containing protein [Acidobacteriota bacterium]MBV9483053.1 PilZ domain-containing protein [Acidobacteriota bacterium]